MKRRAPTLTRKLIKRTLVNLPVYRPVMKFAPRRGPAALRSRSVQEIKSVDDNLGGAAQSLNTTANIVPLNLVQAGSSFNNRVGRKLEMKSLYITGAVVVRSYASSTLQEDYARIIVVYDRQTNGALPAIGDYLLSVNQAGGTSSTVFDQFNVNNRDRFVTLADMRLTLPVVGLAGAGVPNLFGPVEGNRRTFNIQKFINLRNLVTQYKADSSPAVIGDIATGSLILITMGAFGAGAESYQLNLTYRLRYTDA